MLTVQKTNKKNPLKILSVNAGVLALAVILPACGPKSFEAQQRSGSVPPQAPAETRQAANQDAQTPHNSQTVTEVPTPETTLQPNTENDTPDLGRVPETTETAEGPVMPDAATTVNQVPGFTETTEPAQKPQTLPTTTTEEQPQPQQPSYVDEDGKALSSSDLATVERCLAQWPNHPFKLGNRYRVRKISTALSFGGVTLGGNDSPTAEPKLVLMTTSVNINVPGFDGIATYNFMNPNGYYCISNQVNVLAVVNFNLHCKAHLASSSKQFNVLSPIPGNVSQNQYNLLSNVFVNRICN